MSNYDRMSFSEAWAVYEKSEEAFRQAARDQVSSLVPGASFVDDSLLPPLPQEEGLYIDTFLCRPGDEDVSLHPDPGKSQATVNLTLRLRWDEAEWRHKSVTCFIVNPRFDDLFGSDSEEVAYVFSYLQKLQAFRVREFKELLRQGQQPEFLGPADLQAWFEEVWDSREDLIRVSRAAEQVAAHQVTGWGETPLFSALPEPAYLDN